MPAPKTDKPAGGERESRALVRPLELRAADGDAGRTAAGYAVLFDAETNIGGWMIESFAPGAFTKSLRELDVVALNGHESTRVVGRVSSGTLSLREDATGLAFENDLPDTTDGRDLAVLIERGDVAGMSFAFIATREEWDQTSEPMRRTIFEAQLIEVTYTAFPAYPDTSVAMRSLEHAKAETRTQNKAGALSRLAARRARLRAIERRL